MSLKYFFLLTLFSYSHAHHAFLLGRDKLTRVDEADGISPGKRWAGAVRGVWKKQTKKRCSDDQFMYRYSNIIRVEFKFKIGRIQGIRSGHARGQVGLRKRDEASSITITTT